MELLLPVVAGLVTSLSPCVLPVLPIIVGSGAGGNRYTPLAIMAGLISSFVLVGLFVSTIGFAVGLDSSQIRMASALVMILAGFALVSTFLQERLGRVFAPVATWAGALQNRQGMGLAGSYVTGALLGAVWSPCVGPTLGAALGLAAQGGSVLSAAGTMLLFGVGAAIPLLFAAYATRGVFIKWRARLMSGGEKGRKILGVLLLFIGLFILTGLDKTIETHLLRLLPDGWVSLITRF